MFGKATFALLVPSEDSNIDRESPASAPRAVGAAGIIAAGALISSTTVSFMGPSVARLLTWRKTLPMHCIHARNAMSQPERASRMTRPDLNLLVTLDILLAEGSVARAARRLRLSPSAMSRALARLRATTGDPLLVRAGRGLVPTPRAIEFRERVSQLVQDGEAVLRPVGRLNLNQHVRTFTLRTSEGFVENFGPELISRIGREAPGVQLRFVQKPNKDSTPLRDGTVDLETGVVEPSMSPELRTQALFRDR